MSILQAIILGLLQGVTEFIPVSSSGHLVIAHHILGVSQYGLAFDVALHFGTLMALIFLFWRDLLDYFISLFIKNDKTRLAWLLILATIPGALIGFVLESFAETTFRSPKLVSFNLLVFGIIMLIAESFYRRRSLHQKLKTLKPWQALVVGFAQAAAIVPGVSRSGSTITAGMFSGLSRTAATRFSFLLAVPIISGAVLKVFTKGDVIDQVATQQNLFFVGVFSALVSGILAINFMLKYISKHGLEIFAYYRIIVGAGLLLFFLMT